MLFANILGSLRVIWNHPLNRHRKIRSMLDYFKLQIGSRMVPGPIIYKWISGSKIVFYPGDAGVTFNICCGLDELVDMAYILHVATENDLFVDVGANVGQYTILACAAKGARGYCIEPIPSTFDRLMANIYLNNIADRVKCINAGVSSSEGTLLFTSGMLSVLNHVVSNGDKICDPIKVNVRPLDAILAGQSATMLKVDVEGYETRVLEGAHHVLSNPSLHSAIIELNGLGAKYGFNDSKIVETMIAYGYQPYDYDPFLRALTKRADINTCCCNMLFIRNIAMVEKRIRQAPPFVVNDVTL